MCDKGKILWWRKDCVTKERLCDKENIVRRAQTASAREAKCKWVDNFLCSFSRQMLNIPNFCFFLTPPWMFTCFLAPLMPSRSCRKHPRQSSSSWLTKRRVTWKDTCFCPMWRKVSFMSGRCGMSTFLSLNRLSLILVSAKSAHRFHSWGEMTCL